MTVDHGRGGGGSSDGIVITLCEVAVWGHIGTGGTPPIRDLVPGLPSGDCHFDACQSLPAGSAGSCAVETNNVNGGGQAGTNGVRICGAASSSTVGWGGEPDRAIDGDTNSVWGGDSCSHTDSAPAWFQLDLGGTATIDHVSLYHRTDCCQDRLESALIYVSGTKDFNHGIVCGQISDHTQEPEVSQCGGAAQGRYVTIDHASGGGGSSGGSVITICEIEVWGYMEGLVLSGSGASDMSCERVSQPDVSPTECHDGVGLDVPLWMDRDYAWINGPSDILDGEWTYFRVSLEPGAGAPCSDPAHPNQNGREGGFRGNIAVPATIAICCANHCGSSNTPIDQDVLSENPQTTMSWFVHPGTFAISGHGGAPCTFYETNVPAGDYTFCCSTCWGSGLFLASPSTQPQEMRECEGDTVTIACATGLIHIIDATYGRKHGPDVCPHSATSDQNCHATESVGIVSAACDGKTTCEIEATNTVFGDPCGGTYKYLTVNYQCRPQVGPVPHCLPACSRFSPRLMCPPCPILGTEHSR